MTDKDKTTEEKAETKGVVKSEARLPIDINLVSGIMPHSYNEMLQFARLYKESGLAPKSLETVQQVAIAIGMCMEVGRPILTGLQDMAVINGKVGIYGDAILAIIRASGQLEVFDQWEEGTEYSDDWVVHTKVQRKGYEVKTDRWSWLDSKRAGFDDPKLRTGGKDMYSPWRRFTRRMMYFKSRNFLLRDEFGDLLKGMKPVEELQEIIDVTPGQDEKTTATDLNDKLKGEPGGQPGGPKADLYKAKEPEKKEEKAKPKKERKKKDKKEQKKEEEKPDQIRAAYWGKEEPEFTAYAKSQHQAISFLPQKYQDEIHAIWEGFHPNKPYPSDPVEETEEPATPESESDDEKYLRLVDGAEKGEFLGDEAIFVKCLNREEDEKPTTKWCIKNCNQRMGCPSWKKYDAEITSG